MLNQIKSNVKNLLKAQLNRNIIKSEHGGLDSERGGGGGH